MFRMKSALAGLALAISSLMPSAASAAVQAFDVNAVDHSLKPSETGLATGIFLSLGQAFSITADVNDTWSLGATAARTTNADGTTNFSPYTDPLSGQTFLFGTLVARIGSGPYFAAGTNFSGVAGSAGELVLLMWDSNRSDNSGIITATVATNAVPLPAAALLAFPAFLGLGWASRRKAK